MRRRPAAVLLAGLALTAASGCATVDPVELPELTIVNLTLADMTLFETEARFEVRIANAGPERLILEGGAVHVYLEGIKVGKGLLRERIEVPRFDSVTVALPVYVNNLSVATRLRPILENKRLSYRIKGVLYREGGAFGLRKLRTSSEGNFHFGSPPPRP